MGWGFAFDAFIVIDYHLSELILTPDCLLVESFVDIMDIAAVALVLII